MYEDALLFKCMASVRFCMFLKEVSSALRCCIYLIKNSNIAKYDDNSKNCFNLAKNSVLIRNFVFSCKSIVCPQKYCSSNKPIAFFNESIVIQRNFALSC